MNDSLQKGGKYKEIHLGFDLADERDKLEQSIDMTRITEIRTMILFSPQPKNFMQFIDNKPVAFKYGHKWNGHVLANVTYLRMMLKRDKGGGRDLIKEEWNEIETEYRKYKGKSNQ
jgi:hypothetical protein